MNLSVQTITAGNLIEMWSASSSGGFTREERADDRHYKG
jgi:hypothetical protein